jgi:hypothetical protein
MVSAIRHLASNGQSQARDGGSASKAGWGGSSGSQLPGLWWVVEGRESFLHHLFRLRATSTVFPEGAMAFADLDDVRGQPDYMCECVNASVCMCMNICTCVCMLVGWCERMCVHTCTARALYLHILHLWIQVTAG